MNYKPYAISWNTTYRCNLRCSHCYLDTNALTKQSANELSTREGFTLIDQIAELNPHVLLILTGGEPLLREDIYDLAAYASQKGMMVVLGTNGNMIDDDRAKKLKESGVAGIGISLDSIAPEKHDTFRGIPGAWESTLNGIEACRRQGIEFQIQTTVTRENFNEIPEILEFSCNLGAKVFNLFFLVCTGKGQELTDITPQQYDQALHQLYELQKNYREKMMVGAKCAPHYRRIVYEHDPSSPLIRAYAGGCPAATHYCRITPEGDVTPCPYMPDSSGNVKEKSFADIWKNAADFQTLRFDNLHGRCGICEFKHLCKGCRARALATTGNQMDEDAWCNYIPGNYGNKVIQLSSSETFGIEEHFTMNWDAGAKNILKQIPSFSRGMVIKNIENYAAKKNLYTITTGIMKAAREEMISNKRTAFPIKNKTEGLTEKEDKDQNGEIPWREEARKRVESAPDFVRPGILKLMQKKARLHGYKEITSQFLSEIRDESMRLASDRIRNIGFDELRMDAWDKAKEKLKSVRKKEVVDTIKKFLEERTIRNDGIIAKFQAYMKAADKTKEEKVSASPVWTSEAKKRLERAPVFVRNRAKKSLEDFAVQQGFTEITLELMDQYMKNIPSFVKKNFQTNPDNPDSE
ncbi:MAG: radical SAM protein [Candidatus Loosdrechtia sp.]|uniref:radical SAM protein n=1 Tax=Candidatus Loosdrechtia sp. TaxID=3101272 RepID=UPI003A6F2120|nr:MAG: radical SAM protein [Candidatus Jettenia sp. AMX2]